MGAQQRRDILDGVAEDLFSVVPLIGRTIRRKLLKAALSGFREEITLPHHEIMELLEEYGGLHITEISEKLQIAKARMTHLIDKLVELGIVERQADAVDRRVTNVWLTANGKSMIGAHKEHIKSASREVLAKLTDEDLHDLAVSLRRLREIFVKLEPGE
jgi:DNA-binding MarR family transcriptional regulator